MIAWYLIVAAGALTGVAVGVSAAGVRWLPWRCGAAAIGSFALIVGWRAVANAAHLNDDFFQLTSAGDVGCLFAGALGPAILGVLQTGPRRNRFLPAVVGGGAGFVVNVVIL